METNKIYNEDCFDTMRRMLKDGQSVDIVLTSPPYCTPNDDATKYSEYKFDNYQVHYDVFTGWSTLQDYINWSVELFNAYDGILSKNGVILYNISYTSSAPSLVYDVISSIINKTNFIVADCISWKKNSALPQNQNPNRLTRVCEFIFVFCRKHELSTFKTNKVKSGSKYICFNNFIEAPNNSIVNTTHKLNGATFSIQLVTRLLDIYATKESIVYDSFMGTGTTAVACKQFGCSYIGSEISKAQVEFANKRLVGEHILTNVRRLF